LTLEPWSAGVFVYYFMGRWRQQGQVGGRSATSGVARAGKGRMMRVLAPH